jgi:hypothetical protein
MSAPRRLLRARRWRTVVRLAPLCAWLAVSFPARATLQQPGPDGVTQLLQRVEQVLTTGDPARYLDLVDGQSSDLPAARSFADANVVRGATRVVVKERDRATLPGRPEGAAYRLTMDVFTESGNRGRLATWRLDVARKGTAVDGSPLWVITGQRSVSSFGALYRLSVAERQYAAKDLVIASEDLELRLPEGSVLTADTEQGLTVLILLGHGQMVFKPTPGTEREQMRLFAGSEGIDTPFTAAFLRVSPAAVYRLIRRGTIEERPANPLSARLAQDIFREDNVKSFGMKLGDLSGDNWSIIPGTADFVAEVHTRRFKTLTYVKSAREPEDISLFNRAERKNIALYTSRQKLAERGRFYDDEAFEDYEVLRYDIDTAIDPARQRIEGVAQLTVRARADLVGSVTLRLAETIDVQSVVSRELGRLIALRVRNQTGCVVSLPEPVKKGTVFRLTITYAGRIAPQLIDREAIAVDVTGQDPTGDQTPPVLLQPSYLYSNRSYWYPQSESNGFATATVRVRVPPNYTCAGSGEPDVAATGAAAGLFAFHAIQPVRYLSVLITQLLPVRSLNVDVQLPERDHGPDPAGVYYPSIGLQTVSTPRVRSRAFPMSERAVDILRFYAGLIGDCPYPTLTLAVVERELPGGHSPGFLAVIAEPVISTPYSWQSDPTNFSDFPEFFIAHELAHQWWGQAVGWKNYHEQWLSEGFAQYFAALYAEHLYGRNVFQGIIGRMRDWAIKKSDEGPVYLGYRIGHVKRDPQLFRAIVYNKSAAVLHMLRRFMGDDAFFRGLRRFYFEWRFRKAGSDDLRLAMEAESGTSLVRFFERWIYESRVPRLKFSWRTEREIGAGREAAVLRFEQAGDLFDVPVTVTFDYEDREAVNVVVKVTDAVTEMRVPLEGRLRRVDVNRDQAAVARIDK